LALAIFLLAPLICGMDSCRSSPKGPERIEVGKVIRTLGAGPVRLSVMEYALGSGRGQVWIASVESSQTNLAVHPAEDKAKPLADLLGSIDKKNDFAAINGGFYDEKGALGLVVAKGRRLNALRKDGGSGVFLVAGGVPEIVHRDRYTPPEGLETAVQSIDRLVSDGRILVRKRPGMPSDARSAVAIDGLGTVYFVVIFDESAIAYSDDRHVRLSRRSTETGTTLYALAEFLARPFSQGGLEVQHALNLDGGFSTAIQVRIQGQEAGVIAYLDTINALVATPR